MTVEGGLSGWQQGIDLLQDRIRLIAVKDFGWVRSSSDGKVAWRPQMVPLEEGIVRWPEVFACLRQIGFDGVVSLHSEYQGSHSWRDLSLDELIEQTRADLDYLRAAAGLGEKARGRSGGPTCTGPFDGFNPPRGYWEPDALAPASR